MQIPQYEAMQVPAPVLEELARDYQAIERELDAGAEVRMEAIRRWDALRRRTATWNSLVQLRFNQDTRNEAYRRARDTADKLEPKLTELDLGLMRKLLRAPCRPELEGELGRHVFALWDAATATYDPVIEEETVRESKLGADYTELLASARFEFRGETLNLPGLGKYAQHADRAVRHKASTLRWGWFQSNAEKLDAIFDELVKLRTTMAGKLGFDGFVGLGYKRMQRIDYGRTDIERYREEIRREVVPLCEKIRARQASALGLDRLKLWDLPVHDPKGNPSPGGDAGWMMERASRMFRSLGGGLGEFFELMKDHQLLDLEAREGKANGGFCTDFPLFGVPFIFSNFNGTKGDVEVFTHEMGHAFQGYSSRGNFPCDTCWPTAESCEIHSMSLEFLTWPYMELFFGDDAERFRRQHLAESLLFLPYGVAVDHFQHLVYEQPDATPEKRLSIWRDLERTYLPWRDAGDIARVARGGYWQAQLHIYKIPFYYVDYTLAQVCALQFWAQAAVDHAAAMEAYVELCGRGGAAPFLELVQGAGLKSPFEPGCLESVVALAKRSLDL